ncbi:GNAT family N-acetyltransferase [Metasolibacillus meyeri]|uniref:GNAT family N-acetyltransferase n=1 Tax=Metasolibacillus meyeri TaxID=1071052 RepID=UPI000D2F70AD|nr:GNAT family N-acetyltransferase [Metasolibacillus meyeri]
MISELQPSDFHKCASMINEQGQIEGKAIIAGINPGRTFVDDTNKPTTGLIWLGNNDGFIFIGDENNERFNQEINAFLDAVIAPEAKKVGLTWFEGVGNHQKWNQTIESLLAHREVGSWLQKVYILHKEDYQPEREPLLEKGYTVHKMDKALYKNARIKNLEFLHAKIDEFWSTPERFFSEGIGYSIVYNNEIVSVCFSGFVVENTHCVDIETLEAHQGKKLAQIVAHHFVKGCFEQQMIPYWDCMEGNKPSVAVAESLGFCNTFNYKGYEFSF